MKTRTIQTARPARAKRRFVLHPLSFAVCLAMSGAALALPLGGKVVNGDATISTPTPGTEVIKQTTDRAIIDWQSFSIAAGEKVRFYQPSSTSITLNRVVGYDPSYILGQMSSNGRIFLLNPYGVVFGAGARIDVGGLVASTLSMSDNDFLASRYILTSVDPNAPAQRGTVRNDGVISAPGGTVVLAGPTVVNTGTITADGGRVGMIAANAVSIDVEGDGLIFFQASATDARNRLDQLGRIQADGGSIEMRAVARGAFADTVLNMGGVIQARSLGSRAGHVVIDGGGEGVVAVAGQVDVTGVAAGQHGGDVTVEGQRVLLDNGSVIDASGSAGGGSVRVGGDFHGANPDVLNSEVTGVASGAVIRADATFSGDGGKVAVWSDGTTRFNGTISAEGGKNGGDGGFVEVSGKQQLAFRGNVSTSAPKGKKGTLLLDPDDISVVDAPGSGDDSQLDADTPNTGDAAGLIRASDGSGTFTISSFKLEQIGGLTNIDLQASNSITIADLVTNVGTPHVLTLTGGSASFTAGAGGITVGGTTAINVTNGPLTIDSGAGAVSVNALQAGGKITLNGGTITLNGALGVTNAGKGVQVTGATTLNPGAGTITLTGTDALNNVSLGTVDGAQPLNITAGGGAITVGAIGGSAPLSSVTLAGSTASLGAVKTSGNQDYTGVGTTTLGGTLTVTTAGHGVSAGATTLAAGGGAIALTGSDAANDVTLGTVDGGQTLSITANGGDVVLGAVGAGTALTGVTINAATAGLQNVRTTGNQSFNAAVSAAGITLDAGAGSIAANNSGNDFTGTITLKGSGPSVSIHDANDLTLAAPTLGNTSFTAIAGTTLNLPAAAIDAGTGSINLQSQGGALATNGTLSSNGGTIALTGSTGLSVTDNISSAGGNISLTGGAAGGVAVTGGKTIGAVAGTITVDGGGGAIQLNDATLSSTNAGASAVTIRDASTVALGNITATGGTVQIGVAADVAGAVTQTPGTTLAASTLAASTAGSIDLGSAGTLTIDNLGNVQRGGPLTLNDSGGGLALTGNVTAGSTGNAVSITTAGGVLALGANNITTTGANDLVLNGVGVTQTTGTLLVGGATTVNAGSGAIDLQSSSNDFAGNVNLTATGSAAIRDANALVLNSFSGNGLTAIAGTTLSLPGGAITSSGGAINLQALGGTLSTTGTLTSNGGAITLVGASGLTINNDVLSGGGAIALTGGGGTGLVAAAGANVTAGAGTIVLDGGGTAIQLNTSTLTTGNTGASAVRIHDASTVALGNIAATAGTVQIGSAADVSGAVTQNAGTSLAASTLAASTAGSINLGSAGTLAIDNLGDVVRGGALTLGDTGGGLALTGNVDSGSIGNAVTIATTGGALALGAHNVKTTGANNLTLTGVGVTQSTGSVIVGGTTAVNAGSGSVALQSSSNDFTGAVTLSTSGTDAAVRSANNLQLASLAGVGATTNLTAIAGGTLTLPVGAITTSGSVDLRSLGGTLSTGGAIAAANVSLTGSAGLTIANSLTATNAVSLNATNAAINQTGGTINAGGATTFSAGNGTVTLGQNNVLNSIGGSGGAVSITEASVDGVALDAINAASLSVSTSGAAAGVTQNGAATVTGATTITTNLGNVALANGGNNFGSVGANVGAVASVSITDINALALDAVHAGSLTLDTHVGNGAIMQNAAATITGATSFNSGSGAVSLTQGGNAFGSVGGSGGTVGITEGSANGVTLGAISASSLAVTTTAVTTGLVTQSGAATVSGATSIVTAGSNVLLTNPGNAFGSVGVASTGASAAVSITDGNALALDALHATTLVVDTSAGNGAVTQNAAIVVNGATVTAGSGAITLTNAGNDFIGAANNFSGGAISVRDTNALTIATLAPGANRSVSVTAGGALNLPASGINAGTGDITLSSGLALATPGTLVGNNISLTGATGVAIGSDVTAGGTLTLATTNANVTQSAGTIVAGGATTVTAGTGAVTLAQALDNFSTINVVSGGNVQIADVGGLGLAAAATGTLNVSTTGVLASTGAISGTSVALTGNGGISLGNNVTASGVTGTLSLASANSAITQTGGAISATNGLTTVSAGSGDITLTQSGNDFSNVAGINASGGAVRLADTNALVIAGLVNGANRDLSLSAGTTITGLAGNIDTGTADLTIAAGSGFTTFGTLRGTNVTLGGGTGGVSIGNNVTALGNLSLNASNAAINQTAGAIVATGGTTTANAGTGAVTLSQAGNNFATFGASGGAVSVTDATGLALAPINATALTLNSGAGNGAITQTGAAVVSGATTINAGTGAVTLTNAGNNFASIGVTGGAVSITDINAVVLNATSAGSLAVNTSAGNGNVTQAGTVLVTGATSVNAGNGAITLTGVANDFGSFGATGGAIAVRDATGIALDAISAGTLNLTAGGAVTQNGATVVSGATVVNAGGSAVTLGNAGNNFASIGMTGGAVAITDINALALDAVNASSLTINTAAGNGNVTQNAAALVGGATTVNAGTGAVTLSNAANNFGSVAATGGAVAITDINAVTLGAINATSLVVNTSAGNGAVTQSGAAVVSGASTVSAGSGAVTLDNAGNALASLGVSGGAVNVVDSTALTLASLSSGVNQAVSITAGGTLTLPASAIDTGTAALTLASGGTLTTVGKLNGTNVALSSTGALTLANDVTSLGTLGLAAGNAPILQTGGTVVSTGTATIGAGGGDVTLAQATNNFKGNVLLSGGAINVHDVDSLAVTGLVSGANRPVTLVAGGSLTLPAGGIDTGTADLDLEANGGSLATNGALHANNVTLIGTTGLTLGGNVTSTGSQTYKSPVGLTTDVTLDAGGSLIDLQGGVNGGAHGLVLASTSTAAGAIHIGAPITNTAQLTVSGNSSLGGGVHTTGNQTYTGGVTLLGDVTLTADTGKVDLQSGADAATHALSLASGNAAADAVHAGGAIRNASQLTITGKSTLASGVTTTAAQLYTDTVTLGASATFAGSSLSFGNGVAAGAFDLGLRADALTIGGALTGTGNASVSTATQGASIGVAGGAGALQLSQPTLDRFASFNSLTLGRADGSGDLSFGNVVLPTQLTVQSGSGNVNFNGTVASAAGQSRNLTVTTAGTTTFAGAVGGAIGGSAALGSLSVAGATTLDASTTTTAGQSFGGALTVGAASTLSASTLTAGSTVAIGNNAVNVLADSVSIAGPVSAGATGSLRLAPHDAAGTIGIAGAPGTLQVSQGLLDTLAAVPTLTLGRADGTGTVSVATVVLPTDLVIGAGSGNVAFAGSIDSAAGPARDIAVNTTGTTSFSGAIGAVRAVDTVTVSGASQIGASITSTGAQTYAGAAALSADSVLSGPSVSFGSTVDGGHALTVNATSTRFGGAVGGNTALTSLSTDAAGTTRLGGNVTTTGNQTYNDALQLDANAALTGAALKLAGTVDGAHALTLNGSSGVSLGAALGSVTPLASLGVTGALQLGAGVIATTGAQSYAGAVTLGADTALTGSALTFGRTVDGSFALALNSPGTTSFGAAVGATTPLASLSASGGGAVQLAGASVDTTGAQSYGGALQLNGSTRLTGSSLTLGGPVSGAADLSLQTNALGGATSIAGTGTLTIAPIDPTLSIGIAGGPGALQIPQATLSGASGFGAQVIGRADGSGTISAGNLVLRSDTTLQTNTGNIDLAGSVDGAVAVTLNSGATTHIAGPIGATTALKSLTTDNNASAADWNGTTGERTLFDTVDGTGKARVITTGAQTYNDPVTATVALSFSGGAITATQASNRFDGTISASAASLQLHSSADLKLGNVTLANGGAIDSDGVLRLSGAMQLNGGTLVLTSNFTPTAIDITDPAYAGKTVSFGFVPIKEASATIVEDAGATLGSAAGSLIAFRSPKGGSIALEQPGNALLGSISAVSGLLGDNSTSRFNSATAITLGFIRIVSSEIHVAGAPPTNGDQTLTQAGLEGDVIKVTADTLTTGTDGLIRARLPFNNVQGSQTSLPGLTFVLTPAALAKGGSFGSPSSDTFVRIQVGGAEGGFITALPKGASGDNAVIFLGGTAGIRPFYDGNGKLTEIRVFYNGDAPRTPQEAGALAAVIALIEEARHQRFEEAVRTENVSSRLRSGVIAEVGAGRPATVGRESIKQPDVCDIKPDSLRCNAP